MAVLEQIEVYRVVCAVEVRNMPADIVLTGAKRISPEITVFWL
jgi:hypothetical protein